jgi:thymidylate synthase (FAD)
MRTDEQHRSASYIRDRIQMSNTKAFQAYEEMLALGAPRELARSVLPVGTYSTMSATANLHNWMKFCQERLHPHAQYEIRVYAEQVSRILQHLFPVTMKHFHAINDF